MNIINNENTDNDTIKKKKQFERLLTNLIDIQKSDSAIYTKVDDKFYFDLSLLLSALNLDKVVNESTTAVPLQNYNIDEIIKFLSNASNYEEVEDFVKEERLDWTSGLLNKFSTDFETTKQGQIELLIKKKQTSLASWKSFIKKANDINKNKNIWPIHIGFAYLSLSIQDKKIFAPLFVKEANVIIGSTGPTLITEGSIKLNYKITAVLKKIGLDFLLDFNFNELSIARLIDNFKKIVSEHFKIPSSLTHKIPTDLVFESNIQFQPGLVLGLFNVGGNYQHKILEQMIRNDEIQNLLEVEINKNICKNKVENIIFSDNFDGFFKIQPTNFIQDYAHISSLLQNTIIWGPPGTGKSQVIANIITNIIINKQRAIVSSQKQAALTVLRNRLKKMSLFCLFVVNDKSENYKNFYAPIQEYIQWIEEFSDKQDIESITLFSQYDKEYIRIVNKIFSNSNLVDSKLEAYKTIKQSNSIFSLNIAEIIFQLNKTISINPSESPKKAKKLRIKILEQIFKRKLKWYEKISENFKKTLEKDIHLILSKLQNYNGDLSDIFEKIENLEVSDLSDVNDFLTLSFPKINQVNDDEKLFIYHCSKIVKIVSKINSDPNLRQLYKNFRMSVKQDNKILPQQFLLKHFQIINVLFPILITTPDIELTMFEKEEFNYLIIDEASQMFLEEAFPLMYLAKIKIFAGDQKQMQPVRWFTNKSSEQYEDDAFGNIDSLLEYVNSIGVFNVLLDKNYRSKNAALMTFNSKHFYESDLKVADHFKLSIDKSIEVINVGGEWNNQVNTKEAELVVRLAQENIDKYKKIILLSFNAAQQNVIEKIIFDSYPDLEKFMSQGSLIVNNLENIQGEEADLLIMSVVYDSTTSLTSTYIARKGGKHALNVATSRAKEKMIICKSILGDEIINNSNSKDLEIFKQWIQFLDLSPEQQLSYADKEDDKLKSKIKNNRFVDFQNNLFTKLSELPMNLTVQKDYKIGNLTIDVVVMDANNQIIIGFCLTDFEQTTEINYAIFKDTVNFIKAKNYPIEVIDYINWKINQNLILQKIYQKIKEHSEK